MAEAERMGRLIRWPESVGMLGPVAELFVRPAEAREALRRLLGSELLVVFQAGYRRASADDYRTTAEEYAPGKGEGRAFLWLHFCRWKLLELLRRWAGGPLAAEAANEAAGWAREAEAMRSAILAANVGLCFHAGAGRTDSADLVGEACLRLMRAIDHFDATRGFRFSTFACTCMNHATWSTERREVRRAAVTHQLLPAIHAGTSADASDEASRRELFGLVDGALDAKAGVLTQAERDVLVLRFGLWGNAPRRLDELASVRGVSRERVRQIEISALAKLHAFMVRCPADNGAGKPVSAAQASRKPSRGCSGMAKVRRAR